MGVPAAAIRLENLAALNFNPSHVIDVGAFRGDWSRTIKEYFPDAAILLVEPQRQMQAHLREFTQLHTDCELESVLLGASSSQQYFATQQSNSRVVREEDLHLFKEDEIEKREITTLDDLVASTPFADSTSLLKIDAQGYENEILKGATSLLGQVEVIQLEVSVIQIGPCPSFLEIINGMSAAGFRLYDLFDPNYRRLDGALWQIDCLFVRNDSELVSSRQWA